MICFECGRYGHSWKSCPNKDEGGQAAEDSNGHKQNENEASSSTKEGNNGGERYGEWISVQRVRHRPPRMTTTKGNVGNSQGTLPTRNQGGDRGESSGANSNGREKIMAKLKASVDRESGGAVKADNGRPTIKGS